MRKCHVGRLLAVSSIAVTCACGVTARAQETQQPTTPQVRIVDLQLDPLLSPKYQDSTNAAAKRDQEWLQITLEYETRGGKEEWIDEITIDWSVVIIPKSGGKPLLLKHRETYLDVFRGTHHAAVYVRPNIIERYYGARRAKNSSVAVYVQMKADDGEVAKKAFVKTKVPDGWWDFKEPNVLVRDDELLSKSETPYAPLDYDYYEHLRAIRQTK